MSKYAIQVEDAGVRFRRALDQRQSLTETLMRGRPRRYEDFWAIRHVNLTVEGGAFHGVIGHNGSGKSTLLKMINRIYLPNEGSVKAVGRVAALIELGAGFHPDMTGRENIRLNGSILGLTRRQIRDATEEIIDFSGIRDFINEPVKHYSSGMNARLGFSIATHMRPDVLLIDEVLAVGDEDFQRRCMDQLAVLRKSGCTILLVSHALTQVEALCDEVTWMDHGSALETGVPTDVTAAYLASVKPADGAHSEALEGRAAVQELIATVRVLSHSSAAIPEVVPGATLTVRVVTAPTPRGEKHPFRVLLQKGTGPVVATFDSNAAGVYLESSTESVMIDLSVPEHPLRPGQYRVHVEVLDSSDYESLGRVSDAARFVVTGHADKADMGLIELPHTFTAVDPGQRS